MKKSMIQRLGCLVASILFAFVGATAFADAWFTAKEAGGDLLATGGTWSKDDASWDASTQTYNNFNTPLKFEATNAKSNIVSIMTSVKFTAKDELTTEEIAGAKGGLAVLEAEDGSETNYWGVVSGAWVKLAGVKPDLTKAVEVSISLFSVGKPATTYINYSIGGQALKYNSNADIATTCAGDGSIKSVEYLGKCELASLSGATADPYVAQGADEKFYKTIAEAGEQAVTIVNATSYTPTATTIGSCNISDPYGFLTLVQGSLADVGLKVAKVDGQVVIRPNFTSNDGDGSAADKAFKIGSAADLEAFRLGVNNKKFGGAGQYFEQTANIALTDVWEGIGKYGKDNASSSLDDFKAGAFQGTYDGGNNSITGLKLKSDFAQGTATNKYIGFFFSTYEATIKNAKFGIVNFGWDKGKGIDQDVGAGIVVGTAWNSTFENVEIIKGTETGTDEFYGTHAISAFVGFTTGTNLFTSCTNSIKLNENRDGSAKVGAFSACNQKNDPVLTFVNCVNKGDIYSTKGSYVAGFSAYNDGAAKFTNCSNKGNVTAGATGQIAQFAANNNGSATNLGGCSGLTTLIAVNKSGTDFNFATIAGEPALATFVKNADLAAGNTYKVMTSIAAPTANIELATGESISFDKSLNSNFNADSMVVAKVPESTKITQSGETTITYTCVEKASATVSITMTGATATVSVADGASVYEGTTITVTAEAATEGYEAPITVKINGVDQKSYTTTASDTSIAIVITATSKIVPIEPDPQETDVPKITVDKDALAERGVDTSDIAKIKTYLKSKQPNGQKGWVNYALGIGDANEVANTPVLVDESTEANKIQIDLGIEYEIDETSGCSAKIVKADDETGVQVSEAGEIILTDATATEVFTVKFVVTDKDGKAETVVEKNVGIENKAIASEMEILSVPFTDMNSAEQISVDKLIKTMNLADGDRLMVYNGTKGVNEGWTFNEGAWTPDSGVVAAAETFVKPGDGLWFQRANPSESTGPIFKFGAFSATKAKTVAPADGWKLVANPNLTGEVNLNNGFVDKPAEADEIQVETATVPTIYTYVDTKWGFDEMQVTGTSKTGRKITKKVRNTTDTKIAPGAGFWFGNSGNASKNLDWSK